MLYCVLRQTKIATDRDWHGHRGLSQHGLQHSSNVLCSSDSVCLYNINNSLMVASGPWHGRTCRFLFNGDIWRRWPVARSLDTHEQPHGDCLHGSFLSPKSASCLKGQNYGGAVKR
ncbi:hypothetical protein VPH35_129242 [Triticum aestivum]